MIAPADRELLGVWAEHGIPDDDSTRDAACELLLQLWADHQELERVMKQLVEMIPEGPAC